MNLTPKIYDNAQPDSLAAQMRRKRFALFQQLLAPLPRPLHILDVGGRQRFWEVMGFAQEPGITITLFNIERPTSTLPNFHTIMGDATHMPEFADQQFDIVFSNSVIEHVGDYQQQQRMAQEVQRVGKRYFVQTPNYYFPIEPHFLFLGFQWLPLATRAWLHHRFNLGWLPREPNRTAALQAVTQIRLLRQQELLRLFPGATLYKEKLLGLTKSFVVYDGWATR
jgi:hypothetical protein